MDLAGYISQIRSETDNDDDEQYTDEHLGAWLLSVYQRWHRRVEAAFPDLFEASETQGLAAGANIFKPGRFGKLVRVLRRVGTEYVALSQASPVNPEIDTFLGYTEKAEEIELTPSSMSEGTYLLKYVEGPHETEFQPSEILPGHEEVIIEWAKAKAYERMDELQKSAAAKKAGDDVLKQAIRDMKIARRGAAPRPGFVSVRYDEE